MSTTQEKCGNCDALIGKLETPYLWNGTVVCKGCHTRLSGDAHESPAPHRNCCPSCGAHDVKKLSIAYAEGTSTQQGGIVGFTGGGDIGFGVTSSVKRTELAQAIAPPTAPKKVSLPPMILLGSAVLVLGLFGVVCNLSDKEANSLGVSGAIAAVGAICIGIGIPQYRQRIRRHRELKEKCSRDYAVWEKQFICLRCGEVYLPS